MLPPAPLSPTLTNPDMILPYGNEPYRDDYSGLSTPSPPLIVATSTFNGALTSHPPFSPLVDLASGRITPPNHFGMGTALSDIGEELESPFRENDEKMRRSHKYALPSPSMSRIDSTAQIALFAVTDDSRSFSKNPVILSDSDLESASINGFELFDGTHQLEMALQEEDITGPQRDTLTSLGISSLSPKKPSAIDADELSSAVLSIKADMILENAKRRLNHMEGNLSRARHSLVISPSPSISSSMSGSSHSPRLPTYDRRKNPSTETSSPVVQQLKTPSQQSQSNHGHFRIFSEPTFSASSKDLSTYDEASPETIGIARSSGDGLGPPIEPTLKGGWAIRQAVDRSRHNHKASPSAVEIRIRKPRNLPENVRPVTTQGFSRADSFHGFNNGASPLAAPPGSLNRSRSTVQMRDLRDQMKDLKGKISTLQQRAREDGMKRRSLQSLRTPSPFTSAQQWQASEKGGKKGELANGQTEPIKPISWDGVKVEGVAKAEDDAKETKDEIDCGISTMSSHYEDANEMPDSNQAESEILEFYTDDGYDEDGYDYAQEIQPEMEEDDGLDENEGIIDDDGFSSTQERHEDRADAFDYQHFFLHSVMGNYSQRDINRRKSGASLSSNDSVETAKGVVVVRDLNGSSNGPAAKAVVLPSLPSHRRTPSVESVSTVASFATAAEGFESGSDDSWDDVAAIGAGSSTLPNRMEGSQIDPRAGDESDGFRTPTAFSARPVTAGETIPIPAASVIAPPVISTRSFPKSPSNSVLASDFLLLLSTKSGTIAKSNSEAPQLGPRHQEPLDKLLQSLGDVCEQLGTGAAAAAADVVDPKNGLLKRLIQAQKVLAGEFDE
ncbi:MAG: hypothetical protein M1829_001712 [Trizodia sp. TS-e1964]|nr:MAG: hypothetical protein M1829_001712 [Trizodia sp. TS-e1964]